MNATHNIINSTSHALYILEQRYFMRYSIALRVLCVKEKVGFWLPFQVSQFEHAITKLRFRGWKVTYDVGVFDHMDVNTHLEMALKEGPVDLR